jgi:signal peptide peptidase SppA
MKHKKEDSPSWSKVLPQFWKKKLEKKRKPAVVVLNLHGVIMAQHQGGGIGSKKFLNIETTEKLIDEAFDTKKLEVVLLNVNSPGGSAVQSELIAEYIRQKSQDKGVPVISFVEDMAASGGYWLACAAPNIFVSNSSILGSIGVISQSFGLHEAIAKLGIERRTHTAGQSKALGDPFMPMDDKQLAIIKRILATLHENFKKHVRNSRGDRLKKVDESRLFSGEVWVGQEAVELGLADGLGSIHGFIRDEFGGEDNVNLVRIKPDVHKFAKLLGTVDQSVFAQQVANSLVQHSHDQQQFGQQFKI